MKVQITPTNKILKINGISLRIWEGITDDNIKIKCYIARIAIDKDNPNAKDLEEKINNCINKDLDNLIPLKLIL